MKRVCVYCASSPRSKPHFVDVARQVGRLLADRGIELVYGGANCGLMGAVADSVMERGGKVIGVIPGNFSAEIAHEGLSDLRQVASMHERKAQMIELSDALLALPGAYGTLDELCEALAWSQLGLHDKPCGLLNVDGYYDHLLRFFDRAVSEEFLKVSNRELIIDDTDPERLLDRLEAARAQFSSAS